MSCGVRKMGEAELLDKFGDLLSEAEQLAARADPGPKAGLRVHVAPVTLSEVDTPIKE